MRLREILGESDEDYRGQHSAPGKDSGSPLDNVCQNGTYPDDFYGPNGFRYYCDTSSAADRDAYDMVMRYRNKPNASVKIYRAVPNMATIKGINVGDWIGITRRYVTEHGHGALNGNFKIITKTVFARDIFTAGDSISEWGYDPQPFDRDADRARMLARKAARQAKLDAMSPDERAAHTAKETARQASLDAMLNRSAPDPDEA